jgi:hypothetical protein
MSEPASSPDARPASPRQVLLGLFILLQLTFLLLSNGLGFLKSIPSNVPDMPAKLVNHVAPRFAEDQGHGWPILENNLELWAQLTGQDQQWALFAPAVTKATAFPCVLLLWDDVAPELPDIHGAELKFEAKSGYHIELDKSARRSHLLLSANEPVDVNDYFRFGNCRLRRYEGHFYVDPQPESTATPVEAASTMNERVRKRMREYPEAAMAYMQWRTGAWQREHPDEAAPKQIILCQRFYRTHGPDESPGWDGPFLIPLFSLRPADELRTLEAFDFTEQRFVR